MQTQIEVIQTEDQPTLCIHKTCRVEELPQIIGPAYGQIVGVMASQGEQPSIPPYVAYFNMDMQALQVEIGFPVSKPLTAQGDVEAGVIPGGKSVACLYTGPYSEMEPAYAQMSVYAAENHYEPTGVAYEYYLNGPETPPAELQTRIVLPLK